MNSKTNKDSDPLGLHNFPRVEFCHRPTPIEFMPRLTAHLGGPNLYVKRDDCTGLATGGNKTRKLEFLLGEALEQKADMLVTQGAVQSNHVRQTAAAARRYGLDCHALLEHRVEDADDDYAQSGNVLLDHLFSASLEFREGGLDMNQEAASVADNLRAEGRRPYFIPGGGSNVTGSLGYADCAQEIHAQCAQTPQQFDGIIVATGSTGTQAGLVAGLHALKLDIPVIGISVRQKQAAQIAAVHGLARQTAAALGADEMPVDKILVDDGYVGAGYGIPAESTIEAIRLAAHYEGLLLDPVYSGKGFAGLLGLVRAEAFNPDDNLLFLHTGGSAALFAYKQQLI